MTMEKFQLPVLYVEAPSLGEAWIKTLKAVWDHGKIMPNHYEDLPSKEATVTVNVTNPLSEPRIHKADYVSTSDIKLNPTYVDEVLKGTIDQKVDEGSLSYTYHRRIWNWGKRVKKHDEFLEKKGLPIIRFFVKDELKEDLGINQMEYLIEKCVEESISRKLQVVTWAAWKDLKVSGAPCLQRIWFRIVEDQEIEKERYLIMQTSWRSRDLYKAWGSNCAGLVEVGKWVASELTRRMKTQIDLIQYVDFSNSLHIYGSDFPEIERTFTILKKRGELP
ncbi:MAG: hypothetical protein EAX96_00860 [Candidatus Lokiarchaeota archaeon]|nr:hypothetical protein [Candidatus Lokiarchaeota archaeon]